EHGLTNMSNGRWKDADQDFSEMPLDPYELARGAKKNGNVTPPDPPDPPDSQSFEERVRSQTDAIFRRIFN
ncbi:hypothetical protein LCGC14_2214450, partial [marine sediment metagenome]